MSTEIRLQFNNELDLDKTFDCGQCFRWKKTQFEGKKAFCGIIFGTYVICYVKKDWLVIIPDKKIDAALLRDYFDLDNDYGKINDELLSLGDNVINNALYASSGIRILKQDLYETLISFIISQNNNIPRIKSCIEKICEAYGAIIYTDEQGRNYYSFPKPEILAKADPLELQEKCRVGYRAEYIVKSSVKYLERTVKCADDLNDFSGVGPKVKSCISLFSGLDRSAFPVDVWVERMIKTLYGYEMTRSEMEKWGRKHFGENAGIAQQYLFYYIRESR